jgi:hypothetical protein
VTEPTQDERLHGQLGELIRQIQKLRDDIGSGLTPAQQQDRLEIIDTVLRDIRNDLDKLHPLWKEVYFTVRPDFQGNPKASAMGMDALDGPQLQSILDAVQQVYLQVAGRNQR